jgi:hypothetical protein
VWARAFCEAKSRDKRFYFSYSWAFYILFTFSITKDFSSFRIVTFAVKAMQVSGSNSEWASVKSLTEERELLLREACSVLYEDQEKYWRDAFFRMYHSLDDASKRASRLKSYLLD